MYRKNVGVFCDKLHIECLNNSDKINYVSKISVICYI